MLSREDIVKVDDLQRELVAVPEWGGHVYLRCLTGAERSTLQTEYDEFDEKDSMERNLFFRDRLIIYSLCDEQNKPLFAWDERTVLLSKSSQIIERLFLIALRLNRLRSEDVDIQTKNFETVLAVDSGSDSP